DGEVWEVVDGMSECQGSLTPPVRKEGCLHKKRKWPLKGWHQRFFTLDNGILKYAKTPIDVQRGRLHGSMDLGLSVMSIKRKAGCIDLDNEESIYHLKTKSKEHFEQWVSSLRHHRQHRQFSISMAPSVDGDTPVCAVAGQASTLAHLNYSNVPKMSHPNPLSLTHPRCSNSPASLGPQARLAAGWYHDSQDMEKCDRDLLHCQSGLGNMEQMLHSLESLHKSQSATSFSDIQAACLENGKKEKRVSRRWRAKSSLKDNKPLLQVSPSRCAASLLARGAQLWCPCIASNDVPNSMPTSPLRSHASNPNLASAGSDAVLANYSTSLSDGLNISPEHGRLCQDFYSLAQRVHTSLCAVYMALSSEREKGKKLEQESLGAGAAVHLMTLRKSLSQSLKRGKHWAVALNVELTNRLSRIHIESNLSELIAAPAGAELATERPMLGRPLLAQLSESQLSVSEGEFYDAQEVLRSSSSSEATDDDDSSISDDVSDTISEDTGSRASFKSQQSNGAFTNREFQTGRRMHLPAPAADTSSIGLWDILRKNIGKDLSKVAMPVELNEPLNVLQRLCEEMEYSDLLDRAADTDDPAQRMVLVATFAVSTYASTISRAGGKPFNPVLGETYECIREDRGFRFIAEQVSHHPPISVCHCDSKKFVLWQDVRLKNKFWGKSMEIIPVGTVNVKLLKYGDEYEWNKVTSCIHNIMGGQRWIEHYGEVIIKNKKSNVCQCKINFIKASYWSSEANQVQGTVMDQNGRVLHRLFGKWNEGMYCGAQRSARCIWRPGSLPQDHELYYGFTRFAIELNELDPVLRPHLPPTDTRFRPDQRFLEEGNMESAQREKLRIEEFQREKRRLMEDKNILYTPRFFRKNITQDSREEWLMNNTYWELRKDPGFSKIDNPILW
uniref:Oxysterol binding protein-like 6 n=1 Tax=Petromyzon marinus TaxID=7757 RepID=S4R4J5_PETMA